MKNKKTTFLFLILLLAGFFGFETFSSAEESCLNRVVISEIYGGGGNSGSIYKNDFVELYNNSDVDVDLSGWSVQYASSTNFSVTALEGIIETGKYYLIKEGGGSTGEQIELPTPDASGTISLSATAGRVALVRNTSSIKDEASDAIIEIIDYTASSNNKISAYRVNFCTDSFDKHTPAPQNSAYQEENLDDGEGIEEEEIVCVSSSDNVRLNEIYPNTTDESKEFVEITNTGEDCVDVSGWSIKDSTDTSSHKTFFPENTLLEPDGYFYVEKKLYLNNDTDTVYLLDKDGLEKDKQAYAKAAMDKSFSFDGADWQWTSLSTPGAENEFDEEEKDEDSDYVASDYAIRLNEVLPNPKGDEKFSEYIELYNGEDFEINLENWILNDLSSTKFTFPEGYAIKPGKYLTLYRNIFKFALNNTGKETVSLLDPAENTITSTTYTGAKENVSYNFDGALWKWSKFLTPNKENKFNAAPEIKIKKIKEGYIGIALPFEASAKDKNKDKLKYTWDFGDGHKSYLQKASHAFKKSGSYTVSLTVDDGSEEAEKTFTVKIKKYPPLDADIVRLLPNPAGNDTGQEWIEIKNNSKKEINLRGWKIATGQENLINHPILEDFRVSAGKIARLTRENALFYLNNKTAKIELRYPDGKTADAVSYSKKKIGDDEIYAKLAGGWTWISSEEEETPDEAETPAPTLEDIPAVPDYDETEVQANLGKFTPNPELQKKKENQIILASYRAHLNPPKPQGRVLGASTIRESENFYTFTPPTPPEKHWAVIFWESISSTTNSWINKLFLML